MDEEDAESEEEEAVEVVIEPGFHQLNVTYNWYETARRLIELRLVG